MLEIMSPGNTTPQKLSRSWQNFIIREVTRWPVWCPLHHQLTAKEDAAHGVDCHQDSPVDTNGNQEECYYAVKGATLVLPQNECMKTLRHGFLNSGDIQQHLQSMFCLLRPEDTLKMAVKLESVHKGRTRYLVIVSTLGLQDLEEYCLLGVDCNETATIGLVLRVLADMTITLDGDGGFSVASGNRTHIFKPVSVQAMWSALQSLHKASQKAREFNHFLGGLTHQWVNHYEERVISERSCLNEWHAMDDLVYKRPPSPDTRSKPTEKEKTEKMICSKLKEIMMSVDLDEVTSKYIRTRLEEESDTNLKEYKSFIDQEMIRILGQLDAASEIFDYLYLGSEWNASNLEELQNNEIGHILNVTREIDNFFPGMFEYSNIRVYDDEATELLKHWDKTYKYIKTAKENGSKVLVHCKMGISRSASVVMAYAMKAYNWNLSTALEFVKKKRNCINPNSSFMKQLEIYEGILDASRHRHNKLWRSKSETSLKSPVITIHSNQSVTEDEDVAIETIEDENLVLQLDLNTPGKDLVLSRPKSWSPEDSLSDMLFPDSPCEDNSEEPNHRKARPHSYVEGSSEKGGADKNVNLSILVPCSNGHAYNVSQNKAFNLCCPTSNEPQSCSIFDLEISSEANSPLYECFNPIYGQSEESSSTQKVSSVKDRIHELKSQVLKPVVKNKKDLPDRKGLVLNLANQFETVSKSDSPTEDGSGEILSSDSNPFPCPILPVSVNDPVITEGSNTICTPGTVRKQTKDLEDKLKAASTSEGTCKAPRTPPLHKVCDKVDPLIAMCPDEEISINRVNSDPFSCRLDKVFDREERKQNRPNAIEGKKIPPLCELTELTSDIKDFPSRQSSFSSCDSAVVLSGTSDRDSPSRQSSWGSCDTRLTQDILSRNSSLGSYDMRSCHVSRAQSFSDQCQNTGIFMIDNDTGESSGTVKRIKSKGDDMIVTASDTDQSKYSVAKLHVHCPRPFRSPADKLPQYQFGSDTSSYNVSDPGTEIPHYSSSPVLCHETNNNSANCKPSKLTLSNPNIPANNGSIGTGAVHSSEQLSVEEYLNLPCPAAIKHDSANQFESLRDDLTSDLYFGQDKLGSCSDPGVVKRITKALEAKKTVLMTKPCDKSIPEDPSVLSHQRSHSLDQVKTCKYPPSTSSSSDSLSDELCVKSLVGKFEPSKAKTIKVDGLWGKQNPPVPLRKSSLDLDTLKNIKSKSSSISTLSASAPCRLTSYVTSQSKMSLEKKVNSDVCKDNQKCKPPPSGRPTSLDGKFHAKNFRHYGKTHPLSKLTGRQRHPNNLYNTM